MSVICTWMRKIFAVILIVLSAYLAAVQFILPQGSIEKLIGFEQLATKVDNETTDESVKVVLNTETAITTKTTPEQEAPVNSVAPTIMITGLSESACKLGTLHRELVNEFLRGDDYSTALMQLQQLNDLPLSIIEWFALLEEYQNLVPEEQELLSLDKGIWGWFFAKTLRVSMVNDHTLRAAELRAQILEALPEFNDFVFNGVYPKGCANVYD